MDGSFGSTYQSHFTYKSMEIMTTFTHTATRHNLTVRKPTKDINWGNQIAHQFKKCSYYKAKIP